MIVLCRLVSQSISAVANCFAWTSVDWLDDFPAICKARPRSSSFVGFRWVWVGRSRLRGCVLRVYFRQREESRRSYLLCSLSFELVGSHDPQFSHLIMKGITSYYGVIFERPEGQSVLCFGLDIFSTNLFSVSLKSAVSVFRSINPWCLHNFSANLFIIIPGWFQRSNLLWMGFSTNCNLPCLLLLSL